MSVQHLLYTLYAEQTHLSNVSINTYYIKSLKLFCPFHDTFIVLPFSLPVGLVVCRVLIVALLVAMVLWLALDTAKRGTRQIVSFCGLLLLIFLILLFSKHPFQVRQVSSLSLSLSYTQHTPINDGWLMFAVVLASFDLRDFAPVPHRPAYLQDLIWLRGPGVDCKQRRGTTIIHMNCFISLICRFATCFQFDSLIVVSPL